MTGDTIANLIICSPWIFLVLVSFIGCFLKERA